MSHQASTFFAILLAFQPGLRGEAEFGHSSRWFSIRMVDADTGRGVPLVELETVNHLRFYTDSNGFVAFHEPGLMEREIFFHIRSHGYKYTRDGFGYQGIRLKTVTGTRAVLEIKRVNIAERLYRITGAGIYRDSVLLGESIPIRQPLLNASVFGSDSVVSTIHQGRIHWFWGDTNRPSYPLGNFHVPFATSLLPNRGGLDPERGVDLTYTTDDKGFARKSANMPGKGPTWIDGLVVLQDENNQSRIMAQYVKIRSPLAVYERGIVQFDDKKQLFQHRAKFPEETHLFPHGHPFTHRDHNRQYIYFAGGMPLVRVRAKIDSYLDPSKYETFTFLRPGPGKGDWEVERNPDGTLNFSWLTGLPKLDLKRVNQLIEDGKITTRESPLHLVDYETGKQILTQHGSVYWNQFRKRWVMVISQSFGSSMLGEIWFAEADRPEGPWAYARKIVTHDNYSFYNPKQHPYFSKDKGRSLFFEGTYTATFSGNKHPTPLYDYNQIMYRLQLDDPRLNLPVAVYRHSEDNGVTSWSTGSETYSKDTTHRFFALPRPGKGTVAIGFDTVSNRLVRLEKNGSPEATPIFHVPADPVEIGLTRLTPMHEWTRVENNRTTHDYGPVPPAKNGWKQSTHPLCHVWPLPRDLRAPDKP